MNHSRKLVLIAASLVLIPALVLAAIVALRYRAIQRGRELKSRVAEIPLGVTAAEADAIVGGTPDNVSEEWGVLMSPVTMLSANNSRAGAYGPPQRYVLRTWKRGDVTATVAIDAEGTVAGRWAAR